MTKSCSLLAVRAFPPLIAVALGALTAHAQPTPIQQAPVTKAPVTKAPAPQAPESQAKSESKPLPLQDVRAAIEKSLPLIERSMAEYRSQRKCFACHHVAIPTFAMVEARRRQFTVDEKNLRQHVEHTLDFLKTGRENFLAGRGTGGKADTAGYALWTLEAAEAPASETTAAVTSYLLEWQKEDEHWSCTSRRPPSEASHITTTYLAARALQAYGTSEQQERIAERCDQVLKWLLTVESKDTEDLVFRLRALARLGADRQRIDLATRQLLERQRDDGGWSQTDALASDAYATGTALVALCEYGETSVDDPAYQRGARFLLNSQLPDGSWHVVSRSKPFQTYFESGFPHGKDQFISMAASCWAINALLLYCPTSATSTTGESSDP